MNFVVSGVGFINRGGVGLETQVGGSGKRQPWLSSASTTAALQCEECTNLEIRPLSTPAGDPHRDTSVMVGRGTESEPFTMTLSLKHGNPPLGSFGWLPAYGRIFRASRQPQEIRGNWIVFAHVGVGNRRHDIPPLVS